MVRLLEKITNHECPRCGRTQLNVYFSDQTDNRVGAWCEFCNLKAYYFGETLVPITDCVRKNLFWGSGSLGNVQSHLSLNHLSLQSGGEKFQVHLELFKSLNRFRL